MLNFSQWKNECKFFVISQNVRAIFQVRKPLILQFFQLFSKALKLYQKPLQAWFADTIRRYLKEFAALGCQSFTKTSKNHLKVPLFTHWKIIKKASFLIFSTQNVCAKHVFLASSSLEMAKELSAAGW